MPEVRWGRTSSALLPSALCLQDSGLYLRLRRARKENPCPKESPPPALEASRFSRHAETGWHIPVAADGADERRFWGRPAARSSRKPECCSHPAALARS